MSALSEISWLWFPLIISIEDAQWAHRVSLALCQLFQCRSCDEHCGHSRFLLTLGGGAPPMIRKLRGRRECSKVVTDTHDIPWPCSKDVWHHEGLARRYLLQIGGMGNQDTHWRTIELNTIVIPTVYVTRMHMSTSLFAAIFGDQGTQRSNGWCVHGDGTMAKRRTPAIDFIILDCKLFDLWCFWCSHVVFVFLTCYICFYRHPRTPHQLMASAGPLKELPALEFLEKTELRDQNIQNQMTQTRLFFPKFDEISEEKDSKPKPVWLEGNFGFRTPVWFCRECFCRECFS